MPGGIFEEVKLMWKGRELIIPPDRMMGAIAVIEEVITLIELHQAQMSGKVPLAKISMAYARVLRYAGSPGVKDDEVYRALFSPKEDPDKVHSVRALETLLLLMVPPSTYKDDEEQPKGKGGSSVAAASSRRRTK